MASDDEQAMRMSLGCWTFSVPPMRAKMLSVGKCWVPHSFQEEDEKQVASDDEQAMRMSFGCWTCSVTPMRAFFSCHKMLSVGNVGYHIALKRRMRSSWLPTTSRP